MDNNGQLNSLEVMLLLNQMVILKALTMLMAASEFESVRNESSEMIDQNKKIVEYVKLHVGDLLGANSGS